jgi:hypothetical protein
VRTGIGTWLVVSASVVLPLAVVLLSLRYQTGLWPVAALATAAAVAVALAELSSRAASLGASRGREAEGSIEPARLRRLDRT